MTVQDLKILIDNLPDEMNIVIPVGKILFNLCYSSDVEDVKDVQSGQSEKVLFLVPNETPEPSQKITIPVIAQQPENLN